MSLHVSKARTQKAKSRAKTAGKGGSAASSWHSRYGFAGAIAFLLWVLSLLIVVIEELIRNWGTRLPTALILGQAALLLVALFVTCLIISVSNADLIRRNSHCLLMALVSLLTLLLGKVLLILGLSTSLLAAEAAPFLLPLTLATLMVTILLNARAGLAVGFWSSLTLTVLADGGLPLLLTGIVATVIVAKTADRVRTRSKVIRIGIAAGMAQTLCISAFALMDASDFVLVPYLHTVLACLINGFMGSVLGLLILPFFERSFRITTDITLLELTDLSHPLLQRLAIEAPGTYHHSLVVASLAQAAADEIGANALLARVCAYFHDIGKLSKPDFFTENIQFKHNPHDRLPPSMSTLVITAHVKEGLSLATLHRLPEPVMDVIREHHGTSRLAYFHQKARSQQKSGEAGNGASAENEEPVSDQEFRYSGPKPGTPESAIIGLADPIEAASRSLEKASHTQIEAMVTEIVNARLMDGQLDECGLTFSQLKRIKESFVFALTSMMHGRTPYPKDEDSDLQPAEALQNGSAKTAAPDPVLDG